MIEPVIDDLLNSDPSLLDYNEALAAVAKLDHAYRMRFLRDLYLAYTDDYRAAVCGEKVPP